ncbi:hypothetical protein EVB39_102 [Rhizobium phage RHph_TM3_3_9]|nr:hypothetical protein EVB39_102 [Rhizobium phage RHph_TM3_3_9]QIG68623.1 hypothetical protein EVB66_102 [Rhizobium phage RHph_TM3_3_13]QIG74481.1 hypothetical protein EVC09_101 [Rhizobium phage RHph_TM3_3_10]QXV74595.1 hypothetical protein [Rhizobium phage RHEph19]
MTEWFGSPQHRVHAATHNLEIAKAALAANPGNVTFALDVQKATAAREEAIAALRKTFKVVQ